MMTKSISSQSTKRIPQRTCIACRKVAAKRELIRLVRTADGNVGVDLEGKKPGRGAYLCPVMECWKSGLESGRLERSLHITLTKDNREKLIRAAGEICSPVAG
jgi:predicted RNA-binding protein YlxR (DUF448 family)